MDAERWHQARELFDRLADVPASEWEARLAQWNDDAEVRAEALALLRADAEVSARTAIGVHAPDLLDAAAEQHELAQAARLSGRRLGPFALVREIGRGGMGQVWLAQRVDGEFEQQVAIKLLRTGWDAADALSRFRAERQILASLTHPNIAHLVDGGVDEEGRPWLALEFVDGGDLRAHCDTRCLDLRTRLRMFLTVCEAVSYAHARLVVHRDIKPSNVLVAGEGKVKLLDFGIAKLIQSDAATSATRLFTPEYAAPEQVRGEAVTTSVDVYALGLLLYELLTGRRPYRVENTTPAAYERAILDQEPTKPSLIVTRRDEQIDADALAARRDLSPERLRRELRGDLDAIVLKALRKEPAQRYASVGEFSDDVKRYLDRQPVTARRGNWRYRAARFVQRHTLAASLALLAVLSLVGGLGAALWQANLARSERDHAETQAESARRIAAFLQDVFENANPEKRPGEQVTAQQLLTEGARAIHDDLKQQPEVRAALLETLGLSYFALGNAEQSLALLQEAVTLRAAGGDRTAEAVARGSLARTLNMLKRRDDALRQLTIARDLADRNTRAGQEAYAMTVARIGTLQMNMKQLPAAIVTLREALELQTSLLGADNDKALGTLEKLAYALRWNGQTADAFALIDPLWQRVAAVTKPGDQRRRRLISIEAELLRALHRYAQTLPLVREEYDLAVFVYGRDHNESLVAENHLADALYEADRPDEALTAYEHNIAARRALPVDIVEGDVRWTLRDYGRALAAVGRNDEAVATFQDVLRGWRDVQPPHPLRLSETLIGLARVERRARRFDEAARHLDEAQELDAREAPSRIERPQLRLEQVRLALDRATKAVDCAPAAEAVQLLTGQGDDAKLADAQATLVACQLAVGRKEQASALIPAITAARDSGQAQPHEREEIERALRLWAGH